MEITRRRRVISRRWAIRPAGTRGQTDRSFSVESKERQAINLAAHERRSGESKNDASNKDNTNRTRSQPSYQPASEARVRKANSSQGGQTSAARKSGSRAARRRGGQACQAGR